MVRRWSQAILLLGAAALVVFLVLKLFPGDEKQIRSLLKKVAAEASFYGQQKSLSGLAGVNRLVECFSLDAFINLRIPGEWTRTLQGRAEIRQTALAVRANLDGLEVEFMDVQVGLGPDGTTATAHLTARVNQPRSRDFIVQELRFALRKIEGKWQIEEVHTVDTFER